MYIGIDIGGTHTRVATGEKDKIFAKIDFPTEEFDKTVNLICEAVRKLGEKKADQIGISVAGPYNFSKEVFLKPPNLPNQESWANKNLSEELTEKIGIATIVAHVASVAALGEATHGSGKGKNPVLYYTVSTGIGSGFIIDGKIFHGIQNPEAGHQIVGGDGKSLESLASGTALKKKTGKEPRDVEGTNLWEEAMEWVAIGITNSILHFSPEIVVVGGGMTKHKEIFFDPVKKALSKHLTFVPKVPIVPSSLGQDNGLIGAIELARQAYKKEI
jgi:glucokinase